MKYKLEPFKDRKELGEWWGDGKPIETTGGIYTLNEDGVYFDDNGNTLYMTSVFHKYQKAIPVITKKIEFWVSFVETPFTDGTKKILTFSFESEDQLKSLWINGSQELIKTEKFSTEIEVSE